MPPWKSRLLAISTAAVQSLQLGFTTSQLSAIRSNLLNVANASWELGTATEALLELSWPELSVFNTSAFPPPSPLPTTLNATDVLSIAHRTVSGKSVTSLTLIPAQGSAADPASLGVAVLLANWTQSSPINPTYGNAAKDQLEYLLKNTPRSDTGAISHRADQVQLWSDFVYMVPPFISYYGALQEGLDGKNLLQTAYDQCRLYRDALRDESGLWRHVTLGSWQDNSHWATGNGWAAAGMLRVLQTLNHSIYGTEFKQHQTNLTNWIEEILTASWSHQKDNGTLFNVIDDPSSFGDTAATALLASVTYRLAYINNSTSLIPAANRALQLIHNSMDSNGWLTNTVNPYTFHDLLEQEAHSPEGQAFVLLLHSAWRDFTNAFSKIRFKE